MANRRHFLLHHQIPIIQHIRNSPQPAVNSSEAKKRSAAAKANAISEYQDGGFPFQLSPTKQNNPTKPIPAVDFSKKNTNKHWRCPEQRAKDLCYTNRIFHDHVQADFQGYTDPIHNLKIRKKVAWWPPYELLATAAKLRSVVRNNRLWNFSQYTVLLRL